MRLKELIECDVLYIHPSKSMKNADYGIVPVGVFPLLESLRLKGLKIHAVNFAVEISINPEFDLITFLAHCRYRILLVDLHWYEHSFGSIEVAKISKQISPKSYVVIGGITASIYSQEILENFESVDFIISGDSDKSLPILVDALFKENEDLTHVPNLVYRDKYNHTTFTRTVITEDISELDYVNALEMFQNWPTYLKANVLGIDWFKPVRSYWLAIARGCPFSCSYCGGSKQVHKEIFNTQKLRIRSLEKIDEEISILKNKFGVLQIKPTHDIAIFYKKYWIQFIDILKKHNIGVYNEFWQLPSIDFMNHFLNNVNLRTTRIALTGISGNEEVRKRQGKKFNNNELIEIIKIISSSNVSLDIYFSPNLPGETENVFFNETIPFIKKLRNIHPRINIYLQPITLEPMSETSINATEKSLSTFLDYYNYCKLENRVDNLGLASDFNNNMLKMISNIHYENNIKEWNQLNYDYQRL
jgi:radical SAM superfamily enzyme YgiQ (UPF0313 family)